MIIDAIRLSALQIFVFLGPGLVLAYLMNIVAGGVEKRAYKVLGRKVYLWFFGWLGTAVHELGHAIMCVLFGHRIEKMVLFNPDPKSPSLGSVEHSHNPGNIYHIIGNFFIGIGPIIMGTLVIYLASLLLLSESLYHYTQELQITHEVLLDWTSLKSFGENTYDVFVEFFSDVFNTESAARWQLYIFFYLLFCIGSSMRLSGSDVKSAVHGFLMIVGMTFIINLGLIYLELIDRFNEIPLISAYLSTFYVAMLFALILNLAMMAILSAILQIKSLTS